MKSFAILSVLLLAAQVFAPVAMAGWGAAGSYEPDTIWDNNGFMFFDPPTSDSKHEVYFNAFHVTYRSLNPNSAIIGSSVKLPPTSFDALLGIWRDCNEDGFIGSADAGSFAYRVEGSVLFNTALCPYESPCVTFAADGSCESYKKPYPHNDNVWVREFISIGPSCDSEQRLPEQRLCEDARPETYTKNETWVWGDAGLPTDEWPYKCPRVFIPADGEITTPDIISWHDCVLYVVEETQLYAYAEACQMIVWGFERCLSGDARTEPEADHALVIRCEPPGTLQTDPSGQLNLSLAAYDHYAIHISEADDPSIQYEPEGSPGCQSLHPATDGWRMYTAAPGADMRQLKRAPDWDFTFHEYRAEPIEDPDAALGVFALGYPSIWHGTRSDSNWEQQYLSLLRGAPQPATYYTFYANIIGDSNTLIKPAGPATFVYGGPYCESYVENKTWDCDFYNAGGSLPDKHRVFIGNEYVMRDIDCYDGTVLHVGPNANGLSDVSGTCPRPERYLGRLNDYLAHAGAQLDSDRDGVGDEYARYYQIGWNLVDNTSDFDTDGAGAVTEFRWYTHPIVRPEWPNARDYDYDGWLDGAEIDYWDSTPEPWSHINRLNTLTLGVALRDKDAQNDLDNDGLWNQHDPDADGDNLSDYFEFTVTRTYPEFADSDCDITLRIPCSLPSEWNYNSTNRSGSPGTGDGLADPVEWAWWNATRETPEDPVHAWAHALVQLGVPDIVPDPATYDFDWDGVASNLLDGDADGDRVNDGSEINDRGTVPYHFDTDGDGLLDGPDVDLPPLNRTAIIFQNHAVVFQVLPNGNYRFLGEESAGTNPKNFDTDDDQLPDGWEHRYGTGPTTASADGSTDTDLLTNYFEYTYARPAGCDTDSRCVWWGGLRPDLSDTDGDGLGDNVEVSPWTAGGRTFTSSPLVADADFDGLPDGQERQAGTDPNDRDCDNDGLSDYEEVSVHNSNPWAVNTDRNQDPLGQKDELNDWTEVHQTGTNPSDWDTDDDRLSDSEDADPLQFAVLPARSPLKQTPGEPTAGHAYVILREQGYFEVVYDESSAYGEDARSVDIVVTFRGVDHAGNTLDVTVNRDVDEYAPRQWGVLVGLPSELAHSTSQQFRIRVVTDAWDGNRSVVRTFAGAAQDPVRGLEWTPTSVDGFEELAYHEVDPARAPSTGGGEDGARAVAPVIWGTDRPNPYSMSLATLFDTYGNFSVYRLKPFAILDNASVLNRSSFALFNTSLGSNLSTEVNATSTLVFEHYDSAFERVDPQQLPGLYQTAAPYQVKAANRWLWKGAHSGLDFIMRQGASFIFGSDDPRAQGAIAGDIVAGIIGYGDIRDVVIGTVQDDEVKVALGGVGIGLTFVGPQADGPFAAIKSTVLLIRSWGVLGKEIAQRLVDDLAQVLLGKKAAGEVLDILKAYALEAFWLLRTGGDTQALADFQRVQQAVDERYLRAVTNEGHIADSVALSDDLDRLVGPAEASSSMTRMTGQTVFCPLAMADVGAMDGCGRTVFEHVVKAGNALGPEELGRGYPDSRGMLGRAADRLKLHGDIGNVDGWLNGRVFGCITPTNPGKWGCFFEAVQAAKVADGSGGVRRLAYADKTLRFTHGGESATAQIDMFAEGFDGKWIVVETKSTSKATIGSTADLRDQMLRQARAIRYYVNAGEPVEAAHLLDTQMQWRLEKPPTAALQDHAQAVATETGVTVKLLDANGGAYFVASP